MYNPPKRSALVRRVIRGPSSRALAVLCAACCLSTAAYGTGIMAASASSGRSHAIAHTSGAFDLANIQRVARLTHSERLQHALAQGRLRRLHGTTTTTTRAAAATTTTTSDPPTSTTAGVGTTVDPPTSTTGGPGTTVDPPTSTTGGRGADGGQPTTSTTGGLRTGGGQPTTSSTPDPTTTTAAATTTTGAATTTTAAATTTTAAATTTTAAATTTTTTTAAATTTTAPDVATVFGAYVGPSSVTALNALGAYLGRAPQYGSDYFPYASWAALDSDQWMLQQWEGKGYHMIFGVPMLPTSGGATLAQGATGAYNQYYVVLAQQLVAAGLGNSILRIGWEFNVSGFPWYAAGQAPTFVEYWQQIVTAMRSVPGQTFEFEWNPGRGDNGPSDQAMGNYDLYYPGNSYADIIGLDVWDQQWANYPGAAGEFTYIQDQPWGLNWLASFSAQTGRPVALPEFGLGWGASATNSAPISGSGEMSGGDDPLFVKDMIGWAEAHNAANFIFWDYGTSALSTTDNPESYQELKAVL